MPCDYSKYPENWKQISEWVRYMRADNRCEWRDWDQGKPGTFVRRCEARNGKPHPITGSKVVLTVMHLDHDPQNSAPHNLLAACQLHHNRYDAPHRAANRRKNRER